MNRREFINGLRQALELKMTKNEIDAQVEYYAEYIKSEVKAGRSESEVVEELGDPWAIAKNLGYESDTISEETTTPETESFSGQANNKVYTTNSKWVVWGILFVIIAILFTVLSLAMSMVSFFAPVILPVFLVMFVMRMFKK